MTNATSAWNTDMKWAEMKVLQKLSFLGKLVITLCTFGFAFPNLIE